MLCFKKYVWTREADEQKKHRCKDKQCRKRYKDRKWKVKNDSSAFFVMFGFIALVWLWSPFQPLWAWKAAGGRPRESQETFRAWKIITAVSTEEPSHLSHKLRSVNQAFRHKVRIKEEISEPSKWSIAVVLCYNSRFHFSANFLCCFSWVLSWRAESSSQQQKSFWHYSWHQPRGDVRPPGLKEERVKIYLIFHHPAGALRGSGP